MPIDFSRISDRSSIGRLLRTPLRIIPRSAVFPVIQGPLRGARWVVGSATHGCWLGSYELPKAELFAGTLRDGMTVFDVGAHVGYYSLIASRKVGTAGKVVAFEPVERNLAYLRRHLALNHASNVSVIDVAVTGSGGVGRFDPHSDSHLGRLDPLGPLEVRAVALDDLVAAGSVPKPDVVKMDIEGEETAALSGATKVLREARPIIFVATHGIDAHYACLAILHREGYSVNAIGEGSKRLADELVAQPTA